MEITKGGITEEISPGAGLMDREWLTSFWEVFTECIVATDARFVVTNLIRKPDSSFTMTDIVGRSFLDIAVDKDRAFAAEKLDSLKTGAATFVRFQFLSKIGRYYRWTIISLYENGAIAGYRGMAVDVTEQTLKEITLNWQRAIIEWGGDFVSIAGIGGDVLYTNPGAYKMTGYDPASGALPQERIFTPEHLETVRGEGLEKVMGDGVWTSRGELVRLDGTQIPIEHTMYSVRNTQDGDILIATIIRDITAFLENERRLEEARKDAEAANIAKSEFLSRMSHEIRTPMNAVIGMINIGKDADDVDKKNYCFMRADSAAKHLLGIINDILDMSKIEADKFELSYSEFDFEKMLKNITNMANVRAEEKHQNFIVNLDYEVPTFIFSDELRLSQVITNLLTNAIKFTPEDGTVILNIENIEESGDEAVLRIEVTDTGIGISKEQQELLFTSFNQADSSIAQKFGGTGLGLAISKRIVELMGGRIWVESELGAGSKFIFTLKVKKTGGKARKGLYDKINTGKMRILLVDDSEETREYFKHLMDALKLPCDVAESGARAVQMIESAADKPYNMFFVDWNMPGMDGIELTRKIKDGGSNSAIVIMISANDWNNVEKEALSVGVNHFIPKPLFPSTLINAINMSMGVEIYEASEDTQQGEQRRRYDFTGHSILIAEDVEVNREIMAAILEDTGVLVDYAENGVVAVSMFKENPRKYDLILMDINMPEMDGYEATRQIRSLNLPGAIAIPIIAMTANVFREDIERCLASGMNDHIGKPIDSNDLFEQMDKYLKSPY